MIKSVYLHIPFCNSFCPYCDFCKIMYDEKRADNYLILLEKEILKYYRGEEVETIYIGGGTPSVLTLKQLEKLFAVIKKINQQKKCEITIEVNCDISIEKLQFLKNKVTRLSFGVQSFNDKILKYLGRKHSGLLAQEKILLAKKMGFNNINVDLMYGMELQSLEDLKSDIEIIKKLDIQHLSFYSLIVKEGTAFALENNIAEETELAMYQLICESLAEFEHYEISNFAKKNYYSQHNLNYWHNNEYYGFGIGAVGYVDNIRYINASNFSDYEKGLRAEEVVAKNEKIQNEFILGLRKISGLNEKEFIAKYGVSFLDYDIIQSLLAEDKLVFKDGNLKLAKRQLYLMNNILMELMINYE